MLWKGNSAVSDTTKVIFTLFLYLLLIIAIVLAISFYR
ncbi:hypothetical protein Mpsy_1530 [Methanolobus psychrophilus R15]|nr:hypothetical protein Mpsy_1530 [Methanolobus psychrophilus R15]